MRFAAHNDKGLIEFIQLINTTCATISSLHSFIDKRLRSISITIAFWNACGLDLRRAELLKFVERRRVDVLLISETFLKKIVSAYLYLNRRVVTDDLY